MWGALLGAASSVAGSGSSSSSVGGGAHSTESGGNFSGGTLGGINFGQYKSTDQNTILIVAAIVVIGLLMMGKK